ncbi:MAG TPA: ABC transporter substrate-binding protein [Gammaproteobacteria bacterium]|nr:ABC transporter substrate-binding protein [Gammaproteobacteria bacterium]
MIRKTSEKLLEEFTANRSTYESDPSSLYKMVNRIAIPHFDFDRMTRIVLGRHYSGATPEQRHQFAEEFKILLVRTYSQALFQYSDEKIKYIPAVPYGKDMIVREEIDVGAAVPVRLEYLLGKKDGNWKVYDVRIDGISLVTTFRKSYNITINRKGLPVLIAELQKKNSIQ